MKYLHYLLNLVFIFSILPTQAQRSNLSFNDNWIFQGQAVSGATVQESISLPHTWNHSDAQEGIAYYRGEGTYTKTFTADDTWQNQRVFIRFEGVNIQSSTVVLNNQERRGTQGRIRSLLL